MDAAKVGLGIVQRWRRWGCVRGAVVGLTIVIDLDGLGLRRGTQRSGEVGLILSLSLSWFGAWRRGSFLA